MGIRRFEDLAVWQKSRELVQGIYRACDAQPLGRDYAMANQIKRAAISVSSNIAEGFERGSRRQQIEGCCIAKGSAGELRCQVVLAYDGGLLDGVAHVWLYGLCEQVSRMLASYIRTPETTQGQYPGVKLAHARENRSSD